ncbi:MAG: hypothetical protein ACLQBX_11475 [Candidatus Limnocylindrales bacterium]
MSTITPGEEALAMYRRSGRWHAEQARTNGHAGRRALGGLRPSLPRLPVGMGRRGR